MTEVSIIILTLNEGVNIGACLKSVSSLSDDIFVVDSGSIDSTIEVSSNLGAKVVVHKFEGYSAQRNWALVSLPLKYEWLLFLDADERLSPELRHEIETVLGKRPREDGFFINRRFIFNGKWIRHGGYYPTWILRLFRRGKVHCEDRLVNEHFIVEGPTSKLTHDLIHEDLKGISHWVARHNTYASLEARDLIEFRKQSLGVGPKGASLLGGQAQRKRWIKERIWNRLPPLVRPFAYFMYRYWLRGGIFDGKQGFIYHFLQGLWFPFLIDVKYLEAVKSGNETASSLSKKVRSVSNADTALH
jgi:glycosyltransferase involved in cell wall biosynthesis